MPESERHEHTVPITIDGREFEAEPGRHQTAADLLRLAGLDPAGYDLGEILGSGKIRQFADSDMVEIRPHEKFVSIRQSAPVA